MPSFFWNTPPFESDYVEMATDDGQQVTNKNVSPLVDARLETAHALISWESRGIRLEKIKTWDRWHQMTTCRMPTFDLMAAMADLAAISPGTPSRFQQLMTELLAEHAPCLKWIRCSGFVDVFCLTLSFVAIRCPCLQMSHMSLYWYFLQLWCTWKKASPALFHSGSGSATPEAAEDRLARANHLLGHGWTWAGGILAVPVLQAVGTDDSQMTCSVVESRCGGRGVHGSPALLGTGCQSLLNAGTRASWAWDQRWGRTIPRGHTMRQNWTHYIDYIYIRNLIR